MNYPQERLLVASADMFDPSFVGTVVLVVHHSPCETMGIVLNRPIGHTVKQLWENLDRGDCDCQQHVNFGGPVPGPLLALHTQREFADADVLPGIYLTVRKSQLEQLVRQEDCEAKFFVGHAGWEAAQLEGEFQTGAWLTAPATAEDVFHEEDTLWEEAVRRAEGSTLWSDLRIKHVPDDPTLN
jgi:putative transcriptional regulator